MVWQMWRDESGAVVSADLVLVATILVLGLLVGIKSVRDAVVTEMADVGQSISTLDQSYSFTGVQGHGGASGGGFFADSTDLCDTSPFPDPDPTIAGSKCVNVISYLTISPVGPDDEGGP